MRLLLRLLLVLAALLGLRLFWVVETRGPLRPPGAAAELLEVPPGASAASIAKRLQELGLVRHPLVFRILVLLRGQGGALKAGTYELEGPLSLEQIADLLARGDVVRNEVTFPEGKVLEEMADIVEAKGIPAAEFLAAARDPALVRDLDPLAPDLEGYLFPDTYDLPSGANRGAILVQRMVQRFRDVIEPLRPDLALQKLSLREVVTLASVVEKETGQPSERPRIAAVFTNRLQRKMPLQTDPTVIYALRKAGRWDGNIRRQDLEIDSPYNTYRRSGLPPGPIASPGREAILATLHPADTKDLYFVSRNDGSHHFSETLTEHERAVDRYQRSRGGRGRNAPAS
ncbi:MAG TPA: endolytic transglycosylase MltG [Vicinamibacteria bacterium]